MRGERPTFADVRREVQRAGSDLVGVRAYFVRGDDDAANSWLAAFKRSADAAVVCGIASSERGQLLLAGARAGELAPLAVTRPLVRGSVIPSFRDPQIVVEDAAGELLRVAVAREQLARGVALSDELRRPVKVQLLARGPAGPRPLAERILTGDAPSAAEDDSEADSAGPERPEPGPGAHPHALVDQLAELRAAHSRQPLRHNRLLAEVAAAHARAVCDGGRVAHELVPGSDPEERLRRAGVQARRVGETVARARSTAAAFAAFTESPSHRLTLLERDFTDAGVAEALDAQGRHCAVILLATWPRFVGR